MYKRRFLASLIVVSMVAGCSLKFLVQIKSELKKARADAATLGKDLMQAGAPWVEGNPL
jgi:hypothetical protein